MVNGAANGLWRQRRMWWRMRDSESSKDWPIFEIFVGGAMGAFALDGAQLKLGEQLKNLAAAVRQIAKSINIELRNDVPWLDHDYVVVNDPLSPKSGEIRRHVFKMIDSADLGILDMTGTETVIAPTDDLPAGGIVYRPSPNVIYEMAFLHGLGVPTIPVVLKGRDPAPFYFNQTAWTHVGDFDVDTLVASLSEQIRDLVVNNIDGNARSNPISEYYNGISLVDISSTTGLATGYFYNFIAKAFPVGNLIFNRLDTSKVDGRNIDKFVAIKPDSIEQSQTLRSRLLERLEKLGKKSISLFELPEKMIGTRAMSVNVVDNYIVDILTPLESMAVSERYVRVTEIIPSRSALARSAGELRVQKFDQQIIDGFEETVRKLSRKPGIDPRHLNFVTLEQFDAMLRGGGAP